MSQGHLFVATSSLPARLSIHQRRYLGSKRQLLPFIHEAVTKEVGEIECFADLFAGTGVVGHSFNTRVRTVIANELLYANYCSLCAFLSSEALDERRYLQQLRELSQLRGDDDNYLAAAYGGRYFGHRDAARIGAIRQAIDERAPKGRLRAALIASLVYSADRIAHTCGHYDAYRRGDVPDDLFALHPLALPAAEENEGNLLYNEDVNELAQSISAQVVYLDPPYNSRQYADAYHVIENIARWQKPQLKGKARKFDRTELKSRYNLKAAGQAFAELVMALDCQYIVVSYSNMENKGDARSRNRLSAAELVDMLSRRGVVKTFERPFKAFSAGRGLVADHAERLYLCRVE